MGNGQKINPGFYGKRSQSPFYTKLPSLCQREYFLNAYNKSFLLFYLDSK